MTPIERRRQSHNWGHIEDALDAGWTLSIVKDKQKRHYTALLEGNKDIYKSKPFACLEWALDEIEEYLDEEY